MSDDIVIQWMADHELLMRQREEARRLLRRLLWQGGGAIALDLRRQVDAFLERAAVSDNQETTPLSPEGLALLKKLRTNDDSSSSRKKHR